MVCARYGYNLLQSLFFLTLYPSLSFFKLINILIVNKLIEIYHFSFKFLIFALSFPLLKFILRLFNIILRVSIKLLTTFEKFIIHMFKFI